MSGDELTCLDAPRGGCSGPIEYRHPLSSTGRSFPRCEAHWEQRLDEQARIDRRYPQTAPADFDPLAAGEVWDETD